MNDRLIGRTAVLLAIVFLKIVTHASTVTDYQQRVTASQKSVETMIGVLQSDSAGTEVEEFLHQTTAEIKQSIPDRERVEVGPSTIEVSNAWLRTELDKFEQTAIDSERIAILAAITERLSAIKTRVDELVAATESTRTKDEDKQKLNEILSREEYQKPQQKEESVFQQWLNAFLDWLAGLMPRPNIAPTQTPGMQPLALVLQIVIYGLIIALVGFLIYKFAPVIAARFSRDKQEGRKDRVILGERIEASSSASDLFSEAEELARHGDLRGAIRKGYIALLCDLADRKMIGLARHKTNRDYLKEVRKRSGLFSRMKNATGSFERHWYGFRPPQPKDWEEFREEFRSATSES